jgi:arginase
MLRSAGLLQRLGAVDRGDVMPPPYEDFERLPGRPRNEGAVAAYSRALAAAVGAALREDQFLFVVGGDCSIALGCLLGSRVIGPRIGLVYIDAHADFATPQESQTGSVASMVLALAVGHGDSLLARLTGEGALVKPDDVVLVGRRDVGQAYGHAALGESAILDLVGDTIAGSWTATTADAIHARVGRSAVDGFWVHVDCDVLDPSVMPATGSLEPGGPTDTELAELLVSVAAHPKSLGMTLAQYDPSLDSDGASAHRLVELLAAVGQSPRRTMRARESDQ